jgi:hypothetical protein
MLKIQARKDLVEANRPNSLVRKDFDEREAKLLANKPDTEHQVMQPIL